MGLSIELESVILRRAGRTVLDEVSLAISSGELTVLTGPRDAGPSALLAVAAAVLRPGGGEVKLAGRDVFALQDGSLPYLRRNIGYLDDEPRFLPGESAIDNVAVAAGLRGFSPREARALATRELDALGLDAVAHRRADRLSAPERRLLGLARALAGEPPLVVLDDPSAGLDRRDRERIVDRLGASRAAGGALLCASRDPYLIDALGARGARVVRMEQGRLVKEPALSDAAKPASGAVVIPFPPRPAREAS